MVEDPLIKVRSLYMTNMRVKVGWGSARLRKVLRWAREETEYTEIRLGRE